ncbi:MAG: NAD-dependent epimerase/dehydratase family protein [Candidatus Hodarchaeota archaeon]
MTKKVLVTGGAGFIGSHLVDMLIEQKGHEVSIIDTLEEQVHGKGDNPPDYLNKNANFLRGSVTEYKKLEDLVIENDVVFHLAAIVGVGQSMYQIKRYIDNNIIGLANLLDILVNSSHNVKKVVIASSNTIYGESKSHCKTCGVIFPELRSLEQLKRKDWEINCPKCGSKVKPLLSDENSRTNPSSIYAFSKLAQEKMGLMIGKTYGINTTILRFFLVYGKRQALSNPYTGVCGIFITRTLYGNPPIIFEDGNQSRDFVNIKDVCQALILGMDKNAANGEIFNVGTGISTTIREVAEIITEKINPKLKPVYDQQFRIGDIRHSVADISKIKRRLGYSPTLTFKEGIIDLIDWIKAQKDDIQNPSQKAMQELKEKGLLK